MPIECLVWERPYAYWGYIDDWKRTLPRQSHSRRARVFRRHFSVCNPLLCRDPLNRPLSMRTSRDRDTRSPEESRAVGRGERLSRVLKLNWGASRTVAARSRIGKDCLQDGEGMLWVNKSVFVYWKLFFLTEYINQDLILKELKHCFIKGKVFFFNIHLKNVYRYAVNICISFLNTTNCLCI